MIFTIDGLLLEIPLTVINPFTFMQSYGYDLKLDDFRVKQFSKRNGKELRKLLNSAVRSYYISGSGKHRETVYLFFKYSALVDLEKIKMTKSIFQKPRFNITSLLTPNIIMYFRRIPKCQYTDFLKKRN